MGLFIQILLSKALTSIMVLQKSPVEAMQFVMFVHTNVSNVSSAAALQTYFVQ